MKGLVKVNSKGTKVLKSAKVWDAVLHEESGIYFAVAEIPKALEWEASIAAGNITVAKKKMQATTRTQLLLLVDDTRFSPAIDTDYFPNCKSHWYWTSTPAAYAPVRAAWYVAFSSGLSDWYYRSFQGFVRACCASQ